MPYQAGARLSGERASKLGHLEVIQSPLVQELCKNFQEEVVHQLQKNVSWVPFPESGGQLKLIFASDGSVQYIEDKKPPYKALSFVKTALVKMDQYRIDRIDKDSPHPFAVRDLMSDSALFHSTAFPLRHVGIPGRNIYNAVREITYESVKDKGLNNALDGALMDTLKWIAYEKWSDAPKKQLEEFGCPWCSNNVATLPYDQEKGVCPGCKNQIYITDMFGFHQTMQDDYAPNQIASDYMAISETLMIFAPIRYYWDNKKETLKTCLFIKDGPLSLRATLAKLAAPIRRFFKHAKENGIEVALLGQEKSGFFYDHLQLIGPNAPERSIFIPNNAYIRNEVQHSNLTSVYGQDTNYGAKLFVKYDGYHKMVFNIPTGEKGEFVQAPSVNRLIGINNIIATLPKIISNRYEGALLPIQLANGVASLSTYPSAKALELFAGKQANAV